VYPGCNRVGLPAAEPSSRLLQVSKNRYGTSGVRDEVLAVDLPELGGRMHFIRFETSQVLLNTFTRNTP